MGRRQVAHGNLPVVEPGARGLERGNVARLLYNPPASAFFWRIHMNRARLTSAALVVGSMIVTGAVLAAQATQAPEMHTVLDGKKFTPPVRGEATVEFTQPATKALQGKNMVET